MRVNLVNVFFAISVVLYSLPSVGAENTVPVPIVTDELKWTSPVPIPGLQFTWIQGDESDEGLYVLRVKLDSGTKIPPHRHPDQRLSTVLSGTLYVGFGEVFDENALQAIESGDVYVAPAKRSHFIWAKTGDVEYQETGLGPTATQIMNNN